MRLFTSYWDPPALGQAHPHGHLRVSSGLRCAQGAAIISALTSNLASCWMACWSGSIAVRSPISVKKPSGAPADEFRRIAQGFDHRAHWRSGHQCRSRHHLLSGAPGAMGSWRTTRQRGATAVVRVLAPMRAAAHRREGAFLIVEYGHHCRQVLSRHFELLQGLESMFPIRVAKRRDQGLLLGHFVNRGGISSLSDGRRFNLAQGWGVKPSYQFHPLPAGGGATFSGSPAGA